MPWFKERPAGQTLPGLPAKLRRTRNNHINGINVGIPLKVVIPLKIKKPGRAPTYIHRD